MQCCCYFWQGWFKSHRFHCAVPVKTPWSLLLFIRNDSSSNNLHISLRPGDTEKATIHTMCIRIYRYLQHDKTSSITMFPVKKTIQVKWLDNDYFSFCRCASEYIDILITMCSNFKCTHCIPCDKTIQVEWLEKLFLSLLVHCGNSRHIKTCVT